MVAETTALKNEKVALESSMLTLGMEKAEFQAESERLRREKSDLGLEKAALEAESIRLQREKAEIETEAARLQQERDETTNRLQAALSHVADTQESARGFVVNLPDILFDVNEDSLKPAAQIVLAKLAGILLLVPDKGALIEGHTDSTGSAEYNLDLSQRRADAVRRFLQLEGIAATRMEASGYGMERPLADNADPAGRKKNRRVEIVISDGRGTQAAN